jgi:hypothetical protein
VHLFLVDISGWILHCEWSKEEAHIYTARREGISVENWMSLKIVCAAAAVQNIREKQKIKKNKT